MKRLPLDGRNFHWSLQPYMRREAWCRCLRCRRALRNLAKHVEARQ